MLRIAAIGAVLIAVLIAVKDHRVLERTHVVGTCSTLAQQLDGSEWRSCVPGRVTGRPALDVMGCTDYGTHRTAEIWHCPATLVADTARQ